MKKFLIAFALFSLILPVSAQKSKTQWLDGYWIGRGYQPLTDGYNHAWDMKLVHDAKKGTFQVSYPTLSCNSTWKLSKADKNQATFTEILTIGQGTCDDSSTVVITRIDEKYITYSGFKTGNKQNLLAYATLSKVTIPQNPNVYTKDSLRQGNWTILFRLDWFPVADFQQATYYRLISYEKGKPVGKVYDYYLNGVKQFEGFMTDDSEPTGEILDGLCTWYTETGEKMQEATYKNGELQGEIAYFNNYPSDSLPPLYGDTAAYNPDYDSYAVAPSRNIDWVMEQQFSNTMLSWINLNAVSNPANVEEVILKYVSEDEGNPSVNFDSNFDVTVLRFDSKGNPTEFFTRNEAGTMENRTVCTYNIAGKVTKMTEYDVKKELKDSTVFQYNENGRIAQEIAFSFWKIGGKDTTSEYHRKIYTYNPNGKIASMLKINEYSVLEKWDFEYNAKNKLRKGSQSPNYGGVSEYVLDYDEKGKITAMRQSYKLDSLQSNEQKYNEKGVIIQYTTGAGDYASRQDVAYQYDSQGNWMVCRIQQEYLDDYQQKKIRTSAYVRKIIYRKK